MLTDNVVCTKIVLLVNLTLIVIVEQGLACMPPPADCRVIIVSQCKYLCGESQPGPGAVTSSQTKVTVRKVSDQPAETETEQGLRAVTLTTQPYLWP